MIPELLGKNATDIEAIWQHLWKKNYWIGRMGITVLAQSAIDIALWDALGKQVRMPLHRIWGHCNDSIPAYGSGCWRGYGPDGMVERAQRYVKEGFKAIKMQSGMLYDGHQDVENLSKMRDALGENIDIMTDVNMAWSSDEAIKIGKILQEFNLYWLEEPVNCEDFKGYLRIAEALDTRVVGVKLTLLALICAPFLSVLGFLYYNLM